MNPQTNFNFRASNKKPKSKKYFGKKLASKNEFRNLPLIIMDDDENTRRRSLSENCREYHRTYAFLNYGIPTNTDHVGNISVFLQLKW